MKQKYFLRIALVFFINFSSYAQDDFETWPLSFDTSDSGISISQESSIVYQGKYGKYAALTAIGTYTILSPKKAQASSPSGPGTGFRVNSGALETIIDQQNEDMYEGIGDMYD